MANVLIVDDSTMIRFILKKCLEEYGHKVVGEAKNGQEAIEVYKELIPDIVILDLVMPDLPGLEVLEKIIEFDKEAKVVIYTSTALQNIIIKAVQLGAKDFLAKPSTKVLILRAVNKTLRLDQDLQYA